jgi:hypothetical protein
VPVPVDDNNVCTTDSCDPMTGVSHAPVPIDDNNVCTTDGCDPVTGVSHVPVPIDDNSACTTDACDPMTGVSHIACTIDTCNAATGCIFSPQNVCMNSDGCCPAGCTVNNDNDCLYWQSGVQQNVPLASLTGWTQCFIDLYSDGATSLSTILAGCNQSKLLLACRPTGSQTLQLVAMAAKVDITFDTGTGNVTHNANGVEWYYNNSSSWGFAPGGDPVSRTSCDTQASSINAAGVDGDKRLCWHTGGGNINGGWRCGTNDLLNASGAYERLIFQAP